MQQQQAIALRKDGMIGLFPLGDLTMMMPTHLTQIQQPRQQQQAEAALAHDEHENLFLNASLSMQQLFNSNMNNEQPQPQASASSASASSGTSINELARFHRLLLCLSFFPFLFHSFCFVFLSFICL